MVCSSLSIVSSPSSSFPSTRTNDSPSTSPSPIKLRPFAPNPIILKPLSSFCSSSPPNRRFRVRSKLSLLEDGSTEKFEQNNSIADFMRFKGGIGDGGTSSAELQTAVVSYRKKFPWSLLRPFLQVDLVSTIHIADKEYFATLQKELKRYDCVLYEMVTSKESLENRRKRTPATKLKTKSTSSQGGFNILGCIQRQMSNVLSLEFQLDCVDYDAENWYHADLDFETFKLLQMQKGESIFTFARDMTIRSTKALVQSAPIPEDLGPWKSKLLWVSRVLPMPLLGLVIIGSVCTDSESPISKYPELEALSRLDFSAALKVFLAKRLTSEFSKETADLEEKSVIIGERNIAATKALRRAIDEGHNKIAILYGGGHMPDLGRRLVKEFDLAPSQVQWVTAWTIKNQNQTSSSLPFLGRLAKWSGWPLNRYQTLALLMFSLVLALDLLFWELFFDTTVDWVSHVAEDISQYVDSSRAM